MRELCEYAVSVGEKKGADEIEAVWIRETSSEVEAELGEICRASTSRSDGMRIRVIKERAISSIFTYLLTKEGIKTAVERALAAAKASKKDEHWDSLPSPGTYATVDRWDPLMKDIDPETLTDPVTELISLLPKDIAVYLATNGVDLLERSCVNSNGIAHQDAGALQVFGLVAVGKLEEGVTPAFQKILYSRKYNPEPQKAAHSITEDINLFKKKGTASSGKASVIFSPVALQLLLRFTLFKALSGENVARGKSLLAGKEGEEVASPLFTLHDNGTLPAGPGSKEMDDEGVPCQDTPLIEEGVLQGFMWNDYWAKRMGVSSTGNAQYNDRDDEMITEQTTMVITPGDYTREELFNIKEGYYMLNLQGAHGSNPESGDFSVACAPAYKIENGEIAGGVVGIMLSDNVFSLLQKIDAVGSESEVTEVAVLPPVRFTEVNVNAM